MKKILILLLLPLSLLAQNKTIVTDIFTVTYSEHYEQPLELKYTILCPMGEAKREGISWKKDSYIKTSDDEDYKKNVWDRGHLAPAAAFSCDRETIAKTFTYLNCALQHEGLNRGPWKELERFERNLAKFFEVIVIIRVDFDEQPLRVPNGAAIPRGFYKTIFIKDNTWKFYFPNTDVSGEDWASFKIVD
jgi:DNA/RNA endonuclease G (NUC1)